MGTEFQGTIGRTYHSSQPWWPAPRSAAPGSPDVVVVVLDDVGFSDFGCYGSEIDTPVIDSLAAGGLRYNNFHTTAVCSATRACLLTGRNHHSVGMGAVADWDTGFPGYRGWVAPSAGTLAEMLRPAGYGTFAVGKWHLAPIDETSPAGPYDQWPVQRGFDRYYGFLEAAMNHWAPVLVEDNHRVSPPDRPGYHLSEDLVDHAIDMLGAQVSAYPEKPFFLYLAFGAAHSPLHAPRSVVDRYRGRFDDGWDRCRVRRLDRQVELGIVPEGTGLAPRNSGVVPWEDLDDDERRLSLRLQEAYAGMLEHTDTCIGRLVSFLRRVGRFDNTLLLVLSDNGATLEGGHQGSVNYVRSVNGLPSGDLAEAMSVLEDIGGPSTFPVYPMGWGQASNTPLKRYKQNTHSGGVRDPLVVSWPRRIADAGAVRPQYLHAVDLTPTILDVLGVDAPSTVNGIEQQPIEGLSLATTFDDPDAPTPKHVQHFEMFGNRALWMDGWKAVTYHAPGTDFDDDVWELYHLDEDFAEIDDHAAAEPERLAAMVDRWWDEARAHQVLPLDDRILERFLLPKPRPLTDRSRFVYHPGAYQPTQAAADLKDVSHTITATVERAGPDVDGVLLCHGDRFGGYSFFVQDGHLVYDYNCGGAHTTVRSTHPVPVGRSVVRVVFSRTGPHEGTAALEVDGKPVGEVHVPQTLATHVNVIGVSVGRNPASAVSSLHDGPFPFGGVIEQVVVEVGDDRGAVDRVELVD